MFKVGAPLILMISTITQHIRANQVISFPYNKIQREDRVYIQSGITIWVGYRLYIGCVDYKKREPYMYRQELSNKLYLSSLSLSVSGLFVIVSLRNWVGEKCQVLIDLNLVSWKFSSFLNKQFMLILYQGDVFDEWISKHLKGEFY